MFRSEFGPFFYKGFDGHKGNVYYDSNELMQGLIDYLNTKNMEMNLSFDYNLLGVIEEYFKSLTKDMESPFEMD